MDIILVSNRFAKARSITLNGKHVLLAVILTFIVLLMAVPVAQNALARLQPELLGALSEGQLKQQSYMHDGLNALAVRVGQMQAQLLRLDSLGARLAKLSGMTPKEFNFDQAPPQGGPYLPSGQKEISMSSLEQQLATLSTLLNDRNDKLMALETLMLQNSLDKQKFPSVAPVEIGDYSSNFGWRIDPFTGKNAMHEGVDFMAPEGTPIMSSAAGIVVFAGFHPQYGNMVDVDHGNDIITRYGHASKLLVTVGQVVKSGQQIAEVGSTGRSTGNHLHFEVRYKGIAQNPRRFLDSASG
jgi:murein DD-endopeptidase MepM/ murein hydrolase activator NlpD